MDIPSAQEFLRRHHRAVLTTLRRDGRPQLSPVLCAVDGEGRVVISSSEGRAKVANLRRDPQVAVCAFTDRFFGPWIQVEGRAELVALPDAIEVLVDYYRRISGEHPDWDDYRRALQAERRVAIRFAIEHAAGAG